MCSVQLRLRVHGGPRASAPGRGGRRAQLVIGRAGRRAPELGYARAAASRGVTSMEKTMLGPWRGLRGARLLPLGVAVPAAFPSSFPGGDWGRGGYHLGCAPESTALWRRSPPGRLRFPHRKGFSSSDVAGPEAAGPAWLPAGSESMQVSLHKQSRASPACLAHSPLYFGLCPPYAWLHMFWSNLRKHNLRKCIMAQNRERGGRSDKFGLEFRCLRTKPLA